MNTGSKEPVDAVTITLNPAIDQTAIVPNFDRGKVNRVQRSQASAGGKGVNVASILSDYGLKVTASGFLGRDNTGLFEDLFQRKHINDCFVRIAGQTRVDVKIADPEREETTDVNFPGQAPTPADVKALFAMLPGMNAQWFVLAGSIPPGLEPGIYRELIAALKAQGRRTVLDTSGEALAAAVTGGPDIIKPNAEELGGLVGAQLASRERIVEAARGLLARGVKMVVVSMGGEGALFVTGNEVVVAGPPRVDVQSTVGAGDAMVAGIVAAQLRKLATGEAARLATAFAADAISHIGGGLSSAEAVKDLMERVSITDNPI